MVLLNSLYYYLSRTPTAGKLCLKYENSAINSKVFATFKAMRQSKSILKSDLNRVCMSCETLGFSQFDHIVLYLSEGGFIIIDKA